jgi:signal transduction histidine kinase
LHNVRVQLLSSADDVDSLIAAILEESERRMAGDPENTFDRSADRAPLTAADLRSLVMFAVQASAMKARAEMGEALRERDRRLQEAGRDSRRWRHGLGTIVATLQVVVLFVSKEGTVVDIHGDLDGILSSCVRRHAPLPAVFHEVPPCGDGEIRLRGPETGELRLAVSRRSHGMPEEGEETVVIRDVTEQAMAVGSGTPSERLAETLRTVGVLTHKVNNPLTALLGRVQLLRARADGDSSAVRAARVVEESAHRVAELIRELATVAKEGRDEAERSRD